MFVAKFRIDDVALISVTHKSMYVIGLEVERGQ